MAGDDHDDLLRFYPGAAKAECDGYGWAIVTDDEGHVREGHCPACRLVKLRTTVAAFVPPRFRNPTVLPAKVAEWVKRGRQAQGLYLAGQVGTGKTHTAWAATQAWCLATETAPIHSTNFDGYRNAPQVIFTRMTDLLDDLRPGDGARQRVRDCQHAPLLILDDLGAEKASEWTQERIYSIVDHRYANCLPLLVTGNIPPLKLAEQTGDRVASRLAEMCDVVPMTGPDRRRAA